MIKTLRTNSASRLTQVHLMTDSIGCMEPQQHLTGFKVKTWCVLCFTKPDNYSRGHQTMMLT
ncbi:hypothetical protein GUITHDRAFT_154156 [Guillardia theta CCMP2712]|uniref:Uncharacterized protein n=1 Tax=Guillardia theta (strain CCMP2712) TaxID=905079 RepID=L1IVQ0_GUITC|nr:hypothetical protein GUITHDRAFT_154156 [Guillardia theta CCMP2712]EKX40323.1 hypothetical protein GUITHDRAFT_154156 [Guillardia theta CCMP2712]|eukprot:XP_005827303.1 hypothetical protein GUITHDRAFT_154156 [Guillardia theta CCMP2712]